MGSVISCHTPFPDKYITHVLIAKCYLEYKIGARPSTAEVHCGIFCLEFAHRMCPGFHYMHHAVLRASDALVNEESSPKNVAAAKRFLLPSRHFDCFPRSGDAAKLDIFYQLGKRRLEEDPEELRRCFRRGARDWRTMSALMRDQAYMARIVLYVSVIGDLYYAEAPLHIFEELLQARPRLIQDRTYQDYFRNEQSVVQMSEDIFALLVSHGASVSAQEQMVHYFLQNRSVHSVHALLALGALRGERQRLNHALNYHLFGGEAARDVETANTLAPIALALVKYGADPYEEPGPLVIPLRPPLLKFGGMWGCELPIQVRLAAEGVHPSVFRRMTILHIGNAVQSALLLTIICSALGVPRLGKDSSIKLLNLDVLRSVKAMLFKVIITEDELLAALAAGHFYY